jgi:hypothetical protein
MIQGVGGMLVLIGAIMWHIASSKVYPKSGIADVWNDFIQVMQGK